MLTANHASRYDVCIAAMEEIMRAKINPKVCQIGHELTSIYREKIEDHRKYILEHGRDPKMELP
jgi:phosphoketolase